MIRGIAEEDAFRVQALEWFDHRELDIVLGNIGVTIAKRPERGLETDAPGIRAITCDRKATPRRKSSRITR